MSDTRQIWLSFGDSPTAHTCPIALTDSGVTISDDMTHEQWVEGLRGWKWLNAKLKMGLADYIKWGELKFGKERVDDWLDQLEFAMPLVNAARQITAIPESIRHDGLSSDHYVVLARAQTQDGKPLPEKQISKWAKTASEQNLSPSRLRESIQQGEVVTDAVARQQRSGIVSPVGIAREIEIWFRRVGEYEGIAKLDNDNRIMIAEQFRQAAEIYAFLVRPTMQIAEEAVA